MKTKILNKLNIVKRIRGLPNFLLLLSFVEMWERFSYYGMRALLVIFLVTSFGFEDPKAYAIYAVFAALSYAGPIIGGYLADTLMGFRKMVVMGAVINALGHFLLATVPLADALFYIGLGFVAVGTGLFKGNISNLLGEFYKEEDPKRDEGFTLFYVAINLGAFLGTVLCGYVAHIFGWHYGFGLAGIGMLSGIFALFRFQKILKGKGLSPKPDLCKKKIPYTRISNQVAIWIGAIGTAIACSMLLINCEQTTPIFMILGAGVMVYLIKEFIKSSSGERLNLIKLFVYMIFFMCFFALEMQLGALVALFAERNVHNFVLGVPIPSTVSQSINPMIIMLFGSTVSIFWAKQGSGKCALRFGSGLLLMALSFLIFYVGCKFSNPEGLVNFSYLFLGQMVMSIGELCLAPLMLSLTTELAPKRMKGAVMGIVMLSLAFSNLAGILIAKFMSVPQVNAKEVNPLLSLDIYSEGFFKIMIFNLTLTAIFIVIAYAFSLERKPKAVLQNQTAN